MRKMKNNLDEMQGMNALKIAERSFWIMFYGLVIAILVQNLLYRENLLRYVAGEMIILCAGGAYQVAANIRKGIWSRTIKATAKSNFVVSFICSAIFSVMFGVINYMRFGEGEIALKSAVVFFGFIFILCYIVLSVMLIVWKKKNRELEEDEEE